MLHTYLICSMEPELYDYENDQKEDYSGDEDWYYQPGMPGGPALDDEDDLEDDLYFDEMNEYDDEGYNPDREI